jgi:hypothetical protein
MTTPLALTPERKADVLAQLAYLTHLVETLPAEARTCHACYQLRDHGWCDQWAAAVPAEAQAQGCDQWQAEIPF